jgi:phosphocarrier protein HPr
VSDVRATIQITNSQGLHVKTSAILAKTAIRFRSQLRIEYAGHTVDAHSAVELIALDARLGAQITIIGNGPDAADAVAAIRKLFETKFGED